MTPSTVEMSVPVAQYTTARDSHLYTACRSVCAQDQSAQGNLGVIKISSTDQKLSVRRKVVIMGRCTCSDNPMIIGSGSIGTHYSPVHLQLHQEVEHAHVMQTVHKLSLLCYITDCLFHETVVHCHQN